MRSAGGRHVLAVTMLGFFVIVGVAACEKGPMQRTGETIDRAIGQDRVIGRGPLEKAGKNVDEATKDRGK
jgi:hypothetical protein